MRPRKVVEKWVETFNNADVDELINYYSDSATNYQVPNKPIEGRQAIADMFRKEFALAKMVWIVENIFEDGECAFLEWKDPLGLRGCGFFHIIDGKIIYQRGYWDKLSFLKQHGLPISNEY